MLDLCLCMQSSERKEEVKPISADSCYQTANGVECNGLSCQFGTLQCVHHCHMGGKVPRKAHAHCSEYRHITLTDESVDEHLERCGGSCHLLCRGLLGWCLLVDAACSGSREKEEKGGQEEEFCEILRAFYMFVRYFPIPKSLML